MAVQMSPRIDLILKIFKRVCEWEESTFYTSMMFSHPRMKQISTDYVSHFTTNSLEQLPRTYEPFTELPTGITSKGAFNTKVLWKAKGRPNVHEVGEVAVDREANLPCRNVRMVLTYEKTFALSGGSCGKAI